MSTRDDDYPEYEKYEPTHLALFGGVATVLLVFAWIFGVFV